MHFAFSTLACPVWDFETIVARAKEYGYEGVEIFAVLDGSVLPAANVFFTDPKELRSLFESAGVKIACLASSIAMTGKKKRDAELADDCRRFIDTATGIGCDLVEVLDTAVVPGHSRTDAAMRLGEWLVPLCDYAGERGVCVVVENALSFKSARELWPVFARLSHPSLGCCWDVYNASLIGERPAVSVPMLNSRIAYTHVKDARLSPQAPAYCKMGEGDVPVENFLQRLRGIGYEGWVTFDWEKALHPDLAAPEQSLPQAIAKLKEWTRPPVHKGSKAKRAAVG